MAGVTAQVPCPCREACSQGLRLLRRPTPRTAGRHSARFGIDHRTGQQKLRGVAKSPGRVLRHPAGSTSPAGGLADYVLAVVWGRGVGQNGSPLPEARVPSPGDGEVTEMLNATANAAKTLKQIAKESVTLTWRGGMSWCRQNVGGASNGSGAKKMLKNPDDPSKFFKTKAQNFKKRLNPVSIRKQMTYHRKIKYSCKLLKLSHLDRGRALESVRLPACYGK